jgi:hypothetical protein
MRRVGKVAAAAVLSALAIGAAAAANAADALRFSVTQDRALNGKRTASGALFG